MISQRELLRFTTEKLARAIELRDSYTGAHCQRVAGFSVLLGRQLHLSAEDLEPLRIGALLHDIGKIGTEDAILRKPGPLTSEEFEIMKTHTTKGAEILRPMPDMRLALPIVRSHHERWDGQGYPDGLSGEAIPRLARIAAVADAFDAIIFDSPYRQGQTADQAFAEIERHQGTQFDPEAVRAFLRIREDLIAEVDRLQKKTAPASEALV
jgi:putative nucleotidyltransferase with HDIG domain